MAKVVVKAELRLRTEESRALFNEALYEAMQELFVIDIVSTAKDLAPVLTKATSQRFPGELRDSIDSNVRKSKRGVSATVFTSCGYGGWVELGTVNMGAEPYIYPAFEQNINRLPELVKEALTNLATDKSSG